MWWSLNDATPIGELASELDAARKIDWKATLVWAAIAPLGGRPARALRGAVGQCPSRWCLTPPRHRAPGQSAAGAEVAQRTITTMVD